MEKNIFRWFKDRDEKTTEIKHYLENECGERFAVIDRPSQKYRVRILNHAPFHTKTLKAAKSSGHFIFTELNK